ncbi:MAG: cadmium resistance protein CadD (predicted permease) [Arcticibacterium sp.]|jgi:cadmium resistance protein CadD (predicted permease)
MKSISIINAFLIGFLVGIIIYTVAKNTWGLLTLIPLFFIYKMVNNPEEKKNNTDLEKLLEERKLK